LFVISELPRIIADSLFPSCGWYMQRAFLFLEIASLISYPTPSEGDETSAMKTSHSVIHFRSLSWMCCVFNCSPSCEMFESPTCSVSTCPIVFRYSII